DRHDERPQAGQSSQDRPGRGRPERRRDARGDGPRRADRRDSEGGGARLEAHVRADRRAQDPRADVSAAAWSLTRSATPAVARSSNRSAIARGKAPRSAVPWTSTNSPSPFITTLKSTLAAESST